MTEKQDFISIPGWEKYQSLSGKNGKNAHWVKLHLSILDDYDIAKVSMHAQLLFILLTVLTARLNSEPPADAQYILRCTGLGNRMTPQEFSSCIEELECAKLIKIGEQAPREEKRREEKSREKSVAYASIDYSDDFAKWWASYPRRKSKADAYKAWGQTAMVRPDIVDMLAATKTFASSVAGTEDKFIPLPATWIRGYRWDDEIEAGVELTAFTRRDIHYKMDRAEHTNSSLWLKYDRFYQGGGEMRFEDWVSAGGGKVE